MTNASKVSVSVLFSLAIATVLVFGAFATITHADDGYDLGFLGGGYDLGYLDGGYDLGYLDGGYDLGYLDGGYDLGYLGGGYDLGPLDGGYDLGYLGDGYDLGPLDDGYDLGPLDDELCGWDCDYDGCDYACETEFDYDCDYGCFEEEGVTYSYSESFAQQSCAYCSTPKTSYPSPFRVTPPGYPSYPPSYPTPPRPQPQPPIFTSSSAASYTNVNTNTCTGGSCNTNVNNIDNSVNGSFNTTPLTPVYTTPPQHLVQYTYPQQPYPVQNLYCVITASPTYVQNGQAAYLSWTSYGANSAWLSDGIGRVAPTGSLAVRPNVSTNYVLTISGYGGTRTCSTYVNVSGTYISLSQIPYTGFDFGTFGNAIYWLGLLAFAVSGAYLALYYRGGAGMVLGSVAGSVRIPKFSVRKAVMETPAMFSRVATPKAFMPAKAIKHTPENLPVARAMQAPKDSMTFAPMKDGEAPRIVVTRS